MLMKRGTWSRRGPIRLIARVAWRLAAILVVASTSRADDPAGTAEARLDDVRAWRVKMGDQSVALTPPLVEAGASAERRQAALRQAAGRYPMDRFTRRSSAASFQLELENIEDEAGDRLGYRLDLYFVAYGDLEAIRERGLFREMISEDEAEGDGEALSEQELEERGIALDPSASQSRQLYRFRGPILDRVRLAGVIWTERQSSEDQAMAMARFDPRFDGDAEMPNSWVGLDPRSGETTGEPQPYNGFAGYALATELESPAGALLVEAHAVLHEPQGWFDGRPLLRSKLPLIARDAVRGFRRALEK